MAEKYQHQKTEAQQRVMPWKKSGKNHFMDHGFFLDFMDLQRHLEHKVTSNK